MDDEERQILSEIKEDVTTIKTVLLGVPDTEDTGVVGDVKNLYKRHNKLSKVVWILIAFLAGSGVLGAGIWGLFFNGA